MDTKEFKFNGFIMSGFVMLFIHLVLMPLLGFAIFKFLFPVSTILAVFLFVVLALAWMLICAGYFTQEPNEARVMVFFGKYDGTFKETGFFFANPFYAKKKLSL